jgi:uncharacterized membrane protein
MQFLKTFGSILKYAVLAFVWFYLFVVVAPPLLTMGAPLSFVGYLLVILLIALPATYVINLIRKKFATKE